MIKYFLIAVLLVTSSVAGDSIDANEAQFKASSISSLFRPFLNLSRVAQYADGAYLAFNSDNGDGARIYYWKSGKTPQLVYTTTAREGFSSIQSMVAAPDGGTLYILPYNIPFAYSFDLKTKRMKRLFQVDGNFLSLNPGGLYTGAIHPKNIIHSIGREPDKSLQLLERKLPNDAHHDADNHANINQMISSSWRDKVAVGYSLYPSITLLEGTNISKLKINSPLIHPPPKKWVGNHDKFITWVSSFTRLVTLNWHNGNLRGLFREGYEDNGFWLSLQKNNSGKTAGSPLFWDNRKKPWQLISMDDDTYVLIKIQDLPNDDSLVTIRITNSLPK